MHFRRCVLHLTRIATLVCLAALSCAASASAYDARLTWSPIGGASGYRVYVRAAQQAFGAAIDVGLARQALGFESRMEAPAAVALTMFLSGRSMGESWHKIEVADRFSMLVELLVLAIFLGVLGSAAQPITSGHLGSLFWGGLVGAGLIVPLLLNVLGGRMRALGAVSAALVLVGGFILRYVVVMSIQG